MCACERGPWVMRVCVFFFSLFLVVTSLNANSVSTSAELATVKEIEKQKKKKERERLPSKQAVKSAFFFFSIFEVHVVRVFPAVARETIEKRLNCYYSIEDRIYKKKKEKENKRALKKKKKARSTRDGRKI